MKRTLSLKREALTDLTPDDLRQVAGAHAPTGKQTCVLGECLSTEDLSEKLGCVGTYNCPTYTC